MAPVSKGKGKQKKKKGVKKNIDFSKVKSFLVSQDGTLFLTVSREEEEEPTTNGSFNKSG